MAELSADNQTELGQLVWARYPGYEEDLRARWEEDQEECEGDAKLHWERKFLESRSRELELENMSTNWRTSL